MKVRNVALDYAKGLGIVAVVFAHLWRGLAASGLLTGIDPKLVDTISSTCTLLSMPVFFLASGLLYGGSMARRHGLKEFAGKFDAIFYPYVIWAVIIGVFEILGSGLRNHGATVFDLLDILWNPHGIFWFLYTLLLSFAIVELMIYAMGVAWAKRLVLPLGLVLLALFDVAPHIFTARELSMSFIYFAIGIVLSDRVPTVQRPSWLNVGLAVLALIALEYVAHYLLPGGTLSPRSVTPNAVPTALATLFLMMWLSYSLPSTGLPKLTMLGERSMDIYLVHLLFIATVRIALNKFAHVHAVSVYLIVGMVVGIVGALALVSVLKKTKLVYLFQPPPFLSLKARVTALRDPLATN